MNLITQLRNWIGCGRAKPTDVPDLDRYTCGTGFRIGTFSMKEEREKSEGSLRKPITPTCDKNGNVICKRCGKMEARLISPGAYVFTTVGTTKTQMISADDFCKCGQVEVKRAEVIDNLVPAIRDAYSPEWFCSWCKDEWVSTRDHTRCACCGERGTRIIVMGYWVYRPDGTKDYFQEAD